MKRALFLFALALVGWTFVLFPVGARVTVINGCVNVRAQPSLTSPVLGTQCTGALGTVVASEVPGPGGSDTTTRANINYDTGVDGWSWIYYLKLVSPPPANKPPVATFSVSCVQLVCTFTSTSTDPDGAIASSRWDFGDLATASTPTATHTFLSGGTFSVALTVTDNAGASSTLTQLVTVVSPLPPPPSSGVAFVHPSPSPVSFYLHGELPVEAVPVDSSGRMVSAPVTWVTSDSTVVTLRFPYPNLSQAANVYGAGLGSATLTASAGGKSGTIAITIIPLPPLPVDTSVALLVGGFVVTNAPVPWRTTFPARTVWSGLTTITLLNAAGDSLTTARLYVGKP